MSGPPGAFEWDEFSLGTEGLLRAMVSSLGTTIISGGHLSTALRKYGIHDQIDHISTAGGALVQYLAGKRLPLIDALERAEVKLRTFGEAKSGETSCELNRTLSFRQSSVASGQSRFSLRPGPSAFSSAVAESLLLGSRVLRRALLAFHAESTAGGLQELRHRGREGGAVSMPGW